MKIIEINKCFEECPHCTGPDWNKDTKKMMFTCQEYIRWIENADSIPDWCPLKDASFVNRRHIVQEIYDNPHT